MLDAALGLAGLGDGDVAVMSWARAGPAIDPLDDGYALGGKIRLETRG